MSKPRICCECCLTVFIVGYIVTLSDLGFLSASGFYNDVIRWLFMAVNFPGGAGIHFMIGCYSFKSLVETVASIEKFISRYILHYMTTSIF